MRIIILECDDEDYDAIQREITLRQRRRDDKGTLLPEGSSNLAGTIMAECCRDLIDYRDLFDEKTLLG